MPTFSSIGIHPELRKRLVTETKHHANNDPNQHQHQLNHHQLVTTPQALLSRNPGALRLLNADRISSRPIAAHQVLKLRYEVATALISHNTKASQRLNRIIATAASSTTHSDNNNNNDDDKHSCATTTTANKRPRLQIPGTASALELLRYESSLSLHAATAKTTTIRNDNTDTRARATTPLVLCTGCRKLDEMVALPAQYSSVSTRMMMDNSNTNYYSLIPGGGSGGLPFGCVTQFSGPPASGKTQLALHLAASATAAVSRHADAETSVLLPHETWYICSSSTQPIVQRLWELCHHNHAIMQRTVFCTAADDYQVLRRLAELESHLCLPLEQQQQQQQQQQPESDHSMSPTWKPVLLVLDSCSGCLAAASAAAGENHKHDDGAALLMAVAATIRRLTRHYNLATVLINGTVSNHHHRDNSNYAIATKAYPNTTTTASTPTTTALSQRQQQRPTKAALGQRWNNTVADIAVWFEPHTTTVTTTTTTTGATTGTTTTTVRATLERHAAKRCTGDECATFSITANGIQDAAASP